MNTAQEPRDPTVTIRHDINISAWIDQLHLAAGTHATPDDGMCVMEAIAWLTGSDFNDTPDCVSPTIRAFAISWNDSLNDDDRDRLFKPLMLDMIGTNTGPEVDERLAWMATDWLVRVHTPAWLRLAGLTAQADQLVSLPELNPDTILEIMPALRAVRSDADAAWAAATAALWVAASAAWDAAWDTPGADAGAHARVEARDAAWAAAKVAARDAARADALDTLEPTKVEFQESVVDLLRRMCAQAKAAN